MSKTAFIYDESQSKHVLREDHVLRPTRLQYTYELLDSYGAFSAPDSLMVTPREAEEAELLAFHTKEYVAAVKSFSRGEMRFRPATFNFSDLGDNPIFEGMYEVSALGVGASLEAARLVNEGQVDVAFNVGGGWHHAAPDHASGFCIFNDPALAVGYLLGQGKRVAYVDIDAHHGDGVQYAFYHSDRVLTISLHETGRSLFPGTGEVSEVGEGEGRGCSVNLPFYPDTDDEIYLWGFQQVVPPLLESFRPEVLVTQLGCDTHYLDPLTRMNLTTQGYVEVVKALGRLAPRWVAMGGGGYEVGVVARAWTLAYGVMMGRDWPDEIPAQYRERYGLKSLRDEEKPTVDSGSKERAHRFAEDSVAEIKRLIFPHHGL